MDFELKAAKAKWEREQRERIDKAKARLERERRAKEEAARRQQAIEESHRQRRIESAQAQLEAEQQEQEDLQLGDGIRYSRVLRPVKIAGVGDKVTLSAADFEALSSQNALDKGPMFFEISAGSKFTHCGVLEFTAADGFVGLPPFVWNNLGLESESGTEVRIRYVRLPKGTYAKLQPEGLDFGDVPNHKAVLETKLRLHAALSQGDVLSVPYGGMEYQLRVLELRPASAISVLETDIEVDVIATFSDQKDDFSERIVQLTLGKGETGSVEEGRYRYFKFNVDHNLAEAVGRGELEVAIRLQVGGHGDADIYVATQPVLFPSRDEHHWASHDTGIKVITLTSVLSPGLYSIAVYGFRGVSTFVLDVEARPVQGRSSGQKLGAVSRQEQTQDGYEHCSNCRQLIPVRTAALHEVYCRRHNIACQHPGCGVVYRREDAGKHVHCSSCGQALGSEELEKHMNVYHVSHSCSCGAVLEMQEMVKHKASACPHRKITCRYCGDMVQAGGEAADIRDKMRGLSQHESSCGSRTDQCSLCNRAVMLKEMDLHQAAVHAAASAVSEAPSAAVSHAVDREEKPRTECPVCGGEFSGVEAFNLHFEREHLDGPPSVVPQFEAASSNFRQTLSVLCPICGMAVHSERDLSSHIDMVH